MIVTCEHIFYRLGRRSILEDVSLTISPGEVVALVGPNGAGKSTCLNVMSGLIAPHEGRVMFGEHLLSQMTPQHRAMCRAMLVQDTESRVNFSVTDIVGMGIHTLSSAQRAHIVADQLQRVGLPHCAQRSMMRLSGGERQRVHLARVLAQLAAGEMSGEKGVLLLDEPISAQDVLHQNAVLALACDHARQGGACVMVLHDLNWAAACADRMIVLHEGKIYSDGSPQQVLTLQMLYEVFGVTLSRINCHEGTGRPYVVPHDMRVF